MTRHIRNALIASVGISVLAVSAATVALANFTADPAIEDLSGPALVDEAEALLPPPPAAGVPLFVAAGGGDTPTCTTGADVVGRLKADQARLGGETVMLADGLEQAFADAWRRQVNLGPVEVSSVLAHVFRGEGGSGAMVDVVEIDAAGCAMSRTLLSGEEWMTLLGSAAGAEA